MAIGAVEGVAVADHPSAGVVTGDGQGVAEAGGFRLRERRGDAVGDDANAAHSEVFQAVQCRHGESAGLGQRRPVDSTAQRQVFLVDRDLPAIHLKSRQHHRVVVVMHLQHQVRGAGITVGIRQGVGKRLRPIAATVQPQEVAVGRVQRVHISAIRRQLQRAVEPREGARRHRPGRDPISALHVIGQYRAAQGQQAFGGHLCIAVIGSCRYIVHHTHVQGAGGGAVVGVIGDNAEALGQLIHPSRRRVRLGAGQGVAVADHPGGRVKPGDGQGIAQAGGDRLREAGGDTTGHHVDTAHGQVLQTVHGRYGQAAGAGQRASVGAAAIHQVFFVKGQVSAIHADAADHHRVVVVVHLQHQVGGAAVAIGVGQGVGEGFRAITAALQRDKIRVGAVQRVGVAAIGRQHQSAILTRERTARDRATGDSVGALGVVVQDVAAEGQQAFRSAALMAVIQRLGHVIDNGDIQRAGGGVVIAVGGHYRKLLAQAVGAAT